MLKKYILPICCMLSLVFFNFSADNASAKDIKADSYEPPFEMYGIAKGIENNNLIVQIPYINKEIIVIVLPQTLILNRIDDNKKPLKLQDIKVDDLLVIKGVMGEGKFFGREISFLSTD
ncbi:MAG: hypothetical protein KKB82_03800 [Candidatus Omnitrophica bacterium]|nr:hypothetical protein [Candidatus Omnitrophota bacterium]MBU1925028.1 hypothetical protein [Candidatus Omnitrophota bacterium]